MAKFSEVFSVTAKVIGALLLIGLLIALGTGTLGVVIQMFHSQSSAAVDLARDTTHETQVNEFRRTMRQSTWNRALMRAVTSHCYFRGMNKQEVIQALGEPNQKYSTLWSYQRPTPANAKCLEYSGENCVQRESASPMLLSFTDGGYVDESIDQCQSLNGDYIYNSDLFSTARWPGEAGARADRPRPHQKTEAEAQSWHTQKFCEAKGFVWEDGCHLQGSVHATARANSDE